MVDELRNAFLDEKFICLVKSGLPHLFRIAELESMRSGKIGMEVGTLRERVLIGLFIHHFGQNHIDTGPITEKEVDVNVFGHPVSIKTKTITNLNFNGVKAVWTVDASSAHRFIEEYAPSCDLLLAWIKWDSDGGLSFIPLKVQEDLFNTLKNEFFKLPRPGTNPRGVEYDRYALHNMVRHNQSITIPIQWTKPTLRYNIYERWLTNWAGFTPEI